MPCLGSLAARKPRRDASGHFPQTISPMIVCRMAFQQPAMAISSAPFGNPTDPERWSRNSIPLKQVKWGFGEQAAAPIPSLCVDFLRPGCGSAAGWHTEPSFSTACYENMPWFVTAHPLHRLPSAKCRRRRRGFGAPWISPVRFRMEGCPSRRRIAGGFRHPDARDGPVPGEHPRDRQAGRECLHVGALPQQPRHVVGKGPEVRLSQPGRSFVTAPTCLPTASNTVPVRSAPQAPTATVSSTAAFRMPPSSGAVLRRPAASRSCPFPSATAGRRPCGRSCGSSFPAGRRPERPGA